jgi:hypothetical protein
MLSFSIRVSQTNGLAVQTGKSFNGLAVFKGCPLKGFYRGKGCLVPGSNKKVTDSARKIERARAPSRDSRACLLKNHGRYIMYTHIDAPCLYVDVCIPNY